MNRAGRSEVIYLGKVMFVMTGAAMMIALGLNALL
jgi:hypothetical protein